MRKAQYQQRGPVPQDVIQIVDFDTPILERGDVLIEVLAAPINPSDILTLTGDYGMLPPLPAVGGNEGVGRITELGDGVEQLSVGQTVLLPVGMGTWSTHVIAKAKHLIPLPNNADPQQLAMLAVNPPTASLLLSEFVDLQPGDWVIQNAANSGVGNYLIQLAKIRGLKTINVVRRESALENVRHIGGDEALVDNDELAKQVAELTDNKGVQLAIDAIGGAATRRLANCLAESGTLVNYGALSGEPAEISPRSLIFNNVSVQGFWLARWFQHASYQEKERVYGELIQHITTGTLRAAIQQTYTLDKIKEAIAVAAQGGRNGKILLVPTA